MMMLEQGVVVPLVVVVVQVLKPYKKYYRNHNLAALVTSFIGTLLVMFYNMDRESFNTLTLYDGMRLSVETIFISLATFLSAAKIYDLTLNKWKQKPGNTEA